VNSEDLRELLDTPRIRQGRRRLRRGLPLLPSLLTVGNLFLGFLSIAESVRGHPGTAALLILLASVLDLLDGLVARLTRTETVFGLQFDSLADLVSFGAAPAVLVYSWSLQSLPKVGWALSFVFLACGAVRLARFNIQPAAMDRRWFVGLPIPVAAITVGSLVWSWADGPPGAEVTTPVAVLVGVLSYLMVSPFRYRSLKGIDFRRPRPFQVIAALAVALAVVVMDPPRFVLALSLIYDLSGPALRLWSRLGRRGAAAPPAPTPEREP